MYIHNMRHAGTSASIRIAKMVIVSALFATTLLVGGKTSPVEAVTPSPQQAKVGKTGNSMPPMQIREHFVITGYSKDATQKNVNFLKDIVKDMSPLSQAKLTCTTLTPAPNITCVLTHVDTTHAKYNMLKKDTRSRVFIYLNAHDGLLSLTQMFLRLSLPNPFKNFIYNRAKNALNSLYRVAENENQKLKNLKNWFLVDVYHFHTKK